jgi:hypothetical protein
MTSIARKMLRRRLGPTEFRRLRAKEPAFRVHEGEGAGGYDAMHPTKGWRRFSAKRLRAQVIMASILGR